MKVAGLPYWAEGHTLGPPVPTSSTLPTKSRRESRQVLERGGKESDAEYREMAWRKSWDAGCRLVMGSCHEVISTKYQKTRRSRSLQKIKDAKIARTITLLNELTGMGPTQSKNTPVDNTSDLKRGIVITFKGVGGFQLPSTLVYPLQTRVQRLKSVLSLMSSCN